MKKLAKIILIVTIGFILITGFLQKKDDRFLYHIVDLNKQEIRLFWKDNQGKIIYNFENLKKYLQNNSQKLVFAMNGGMYLKDRSPQGLYIENGKILKQIDTVQHAYGNFYMQPNGVFYITKNKKAFVSRSTDFTAKDVMFATQSGPMLLINDKMHPRFIKGSKNLNIRNGVGILRDGKILFAISKEKVNFYDFATFFQSFGCKNALYLDGFVSKIYFPKENRVDNGGRFGVIIGEISDTSN